MSGGEFDRGGVSGGEFDWGGMCPVGSLTGAVCVRWGSLTGEVCVRWGV